ncbi:unnamed protein product [Toxocara canis]|uniref:Actin-related protein 6 n=1 Tax=Toxocara canis TaxID=6265 RepID=A0A183TY53_TOXCA|nr:unnamed protein product [Toxocara canis]
MSKTLILDNGVSTYLHYYFRVFANCIVKAKSERKRVYVADEVEECRDHSSLFFLIPAEKGYIVNWDVEQKVWNRVLGKDVLDVCFNDTRLVLTDPIYNVPAIEDLSDEILFEQYRFHSVAKTSASSLIAIADTVSLEYRTERCCVVVDSGYSFTHIVPYYNGVAIRDGIIRIDVGGKVLTNLLKEWVSYRQLNVLEETYVMNECKEDACYVADNFEKHMQIARKRGKDNTIAREYVLPDFVTHHRGFVREPRANEGDESQKLTLNVERFAVPEALFSPSDIGLQQMGIPEAIVTSIKKCPKAMHGRLYNNIFLVGGNSLFDGYRQRVLVLYFLQCLKKLYLAL